MLSTRWETEERLIGIEVADRNTIVHGTFMIELWALTYIRAQLSAFILSFFPFPFPFPPLLRFLFSLLLDLFYPVFFRPFSIDIFERYSC